MSFRQPHNSKDGGLGIAVGAIDEADPMAAVSLNGQLGLISGKCAGMPGIFGTSAVTISGDSSGGGFHHRFSVSPFGGGSGQLACPGGFTDFRFGRAQAIDLFIDRSDEVRGPVLRIRYDGGIAEKVAKASVLKSLAVLRIFKFSMESIHPIQPTISPIPGATILSRYWVSVIWALARRKTSRG